MMQLNAHSNDKGGSNQQKDDTKGKAVDEMDIDSKKKKSELDSKL